jgi:pimeloyl-ACP methyl ester carboxylesterase
VTRPGYPGSDPHPGRTVADAARDVLSVVDALGIDRFATAGASGGGSHALALGGLAPDRVTAIVALAAIAPFDHSPDWFSGMVAPGALRAALSGREARLAYAETAEFDPESFTARDFDALDGPWRALGADAQAGYADGPTGEADDDLAYVSPWGVELRAVRPPVLLIQGGADRVVPAPHAAAMLERLPSAELWIRPREGHISVLTALGVALDWARSPS